MKKKSLGFQGTLWGLLLIFCWDQIVWVTPQTLSGPSAIQSLAGPRPSQKNQGDRSEGIEVEKRIQDVSAVNEISETSVAESSFPKRLLNALILIGVIGIAVTGMMLLQDDFSLRLSVPRELDGWGSFPFLVGRCWLKDLKKTIGEKLRNGDPIDKEQIKAHLSLHYRTFDLSDEDMDEVIQEVSEGISRLQEKLTDLLVGSLSQKKLGGLDYEDPDVGHEISESILQGLVLEKIVPRVNQAKLGEISQEELIQGIAKELKESIFRDSPEVTEHILEGVLRDNPEIFEKVEELKNAIKAMAIFHKGDDGTPPDKGGAKPIQPAGKKKLGHHHHHFLDGKKILMAGVVLFSLSALGFLLEHWGLLPGSWMIANAKWDLVKWSLVLAVLSVPPNSASPPPAQQGNGELPSYFEDLTEYYRGLIRADSTLAKTENDPSMFRGNELAEIIRTLKQTGISNCFLMGEAGVGKTAIAEGLAWRIACQTTHQPWLNQFRVLKLDPSSFLALYGSSVDTYNVGIKEVEGIAGAKETILFIDEAHLLSDLYAGSPPGFFEGLKAAMSRGKTKLICATTDEELRRYFESNKALMRRFTRVTVTPLKTNEAIEVAKRSKVRFERSQNEGVEDTTQHIRISDEACISAVTLTDRGIPDRPQIGKTIDILDRAAARKRTQTGIDRFLLEATKENIVRYVKDIREAIGYEERELKERAIQQLEEEVEQLMLLEGKLQRGMTYTVMPSDIIEALADMGVQLNEITQEEAGKIAGLRDFLQENLKGQDHVIDPVVRAIARRYVYKNRKKSMASFLLAGPTGTGKTELARLLARYFFGSEDEMIVIDCSKLRDDHVVGPRLIGAPAGYVGYGDEGNLVDQVREKPFCVILFDEVEKAHPTLFRQLLGVLAEGRLEGASKGKIAYFNNTIILFTSNIGVPPQWYTKMDEKQLKAEIEIAIQRMLAPEFRNRLDGYLIYNSLSEAMVRYIIENVTLLQVQQRYDREYGIQLVFDRTSTKGFERYSFSHVGHEELVGVRNLAVAEDGEVYALTSRGVEVINKEGVKRLLIEKERADADSLLLREEEGIVKEIELMEMGIAQRIFDREGQLLKETQRKDSNQPLLKRLRVKGDVCSLFGDGQMVVKSEKGEVLHEISEGVVDITANREESRLYVLLKGSEGYGVLIYDMISGKLKRSLKVENTQQPRCIAVDHEGTILLGLQQGISFYQDSEADPIVELMLEKGYHPEYGAREIIRGAVQPLLDDAISDILQTGKVEKGDMIWVKREGDHFSFRVEKNTEDISQIVLRGKNEKTQQLLDRMVEAIEALDYEEAFTLEQLDRLLDEPPSNFKRTSNFYADTLLVMPQPTTRTRLEEYTPRKEDASLARAISAIASSLTKEKQKEVSAIIKRLVAVAKKKVLDSISQLYINMDFEKGDVRRRQEIINEANLRQPVELEWHLGDEELFVKISYRGYIHREEAEWIITHFGHDQMSEEAIYQNQAMSDHGFALTRASILLHGGECGYERTEEKGTLWFRLQGFPSPPSTAPQPSPAVPTTTPPQLGPSGITSVGTARLGDDTGQTPKPVAPVQSVAGDRSQQSGEQRQELPTANDEQLTPDTVAQVIESELSELQATQLIGSLRRGVKTLEQELNKWQWEKIEGKHDRAELTNLLDPSALLSNPQATENIGILWDHVAQRTLEFLRNPESYKNLASRFKSAANDPRFSSPESLPAIRWKSARLLGELSDALPQATGLEIRFSDVFLREWAEYLFDEEESEVLGHNAYWTRRGVRWSLSQLSHNLIERTTHIKREVLPLDVIVKLLASLWRSEEGIHPWRVPHSEVNTIGSLTTYYLSPISGKAVFFTMEDFQTTLQRVTQEVEPELSDEVEKLEWHGLHDSDDPAIRRLVSLTYGRLYLKAREVVLQSEEVPVEQIQRESLSLLRSLENHPIQEVREIARWLEKEIKAGQNQGNSLEVLAVERLTSNLIAPPPVSQTNTLTDEQVEDLPQGEWLHGVSNRLKEILALKGWNISDLARESRISPTQLQRYINESKSITVKVLNEIISAIRRDLSGVEQAEKLSGQYILRGEEGLQEGFPLPKGIKYRGGTLGQRIQHLRLIHGDRVKISASTKLGMLPNQISELEKVSPNTFTWNIYLISKTYSCSVDWITDSVAAQEKNEYWVLQEFKTQPPKNASIAQVMQAVLKERGMDLQSLAFEMAKFRKEGKEPTQQEASVAKGWLLKMFEGKRDFKISTAIEIASVLGVSLDKLLRGKEDIVIPDDMTLYPETFPKRVKYLREKKRLTLTDLARKIKCSVPAVVWMEKEPHRDIYSRLAVALADELDVSLDLLFPQALRLAQSTKINEEEERTLKIEITHLEGMIATLQSMLNEKKHRLFGVQQKRFLHHQQEELSPLQMAL